MKARSQAHSSPGAHLHSSALTRRPRKGHPEERADVTDRAASSPFTAKFFMAQNSPWWWTCSSFWFNRHALSRTHDLRDSPTPQWSTDAAIRPPSLEPRTAVARARPHTLEEPFCGKSCTLTCGDASSNYTSQKILFSGAVANSWSRCELVITMARGLILCLLHALAVASALVITPAVRAVRLAPRAACPTMDGDGPMVGKCKWFK